MNNKMTKKNLENSVKEKNYHHNLWEGALYIGIASLLGIFAYTAGNFSYETEKLAIKVMSCSEETYSRLSAFALGTEIFSGVCKAGSIVIAGSGVYRFFNKRKE
jgi:hypothetical protein